MYDTSFAAYFVYQNASHFANSETVRRNDYFGQRKYGGKSIMKEDYYSYIKDGFKRWAPIYDIWTIFISKVRDKVVDFTCIIESVQLSLCSVKTVRIS